MEQHGELCMADGGVTALHHSSCDSSDSSASREPPLATSPYIFGRGSGSESTGQGRSGTATVGVVKLFTRGTVATHHWELEPRRSVLGSKGEGRVWAGEESEKDEVREERR